MVFANNKVAFCSLRKRCLIRIYNGIFTMFIICFEFPIIRYCCKCYDHGWTDVVVTNTDLSMILSFPQQSTPWSCGILCNKCIVIFRRNTYILLPIVIECVVWTTNGISLINHLPFAPRTDVGLWLSSFYVFYFCSLEKVCWICLLLGR